MLQYRMENKVFYFIYFIYYLQLVGFGRATRPRTHLFKLRNSVADPGC
jgi:hypothetical protein